MKKVAILYDFDKTLCAKDMQEYSLIPELGYEDPGLFWKEVTQLSKANHMDGISAYLYLLQKKFAEQGRPLRKRDFLDLGAKIELYPGVDTWFDRVNAYGRQIGLDIEHYVISSGMSEIIEGVSVADRFRKIYACRYYYDEAGVAVWPSQVINYTTKTQYLFRINKQVLDENEDEELNTWIPTRERPIPFSRMIYMADGLTDVPCMRLVKTYGGKSVAVYNPQSEKARHVAEKLLQEGRAHYMNRADYSEGEGMEKLIFMILDHMSADAKLDELEGILR